MHSPSIFRSPARPRLRVDTKGRKDDKCDPEVEVCPYPHTSKYLSPEVEIHIRSPAVKQVERRGERPPRAVPMFGDRDHVEGTVYLDARFAATPGRLTIIGEGAFVYISPFSVTRGASTLDAPTPAKTRHLFFSSATVYVSGESSSPRSATSLREAFAASMRSKKMERRPSLQELEGAPKKAFSFSFELPRPVRPGEELPPTFSTLCVGEVGYRGRTAVERAEVEYKVSAVWESLDSNQHAKLDAPLLFQPDTDFQSLDGFSLEPESWLEIPLRSDRPIPFKCAVTLPVPSSFPRSAFVPFFVVFTTTPRSPLLAREIAVDATIAVSLLRQVTIVNSRPTPSHSPSSSTASSLSDDPEGGSKRTTRLLKRMTRTSIRSKSPKRQPYHAVKDKPLPALPTPGVLETRTLQTDVCVGFPKRPRHRVQPNQKHPSLDSHAALPDGLYKGKIRLDKSMLPSIDFSGLNVKYFLDVSVLFGQDELRARIPIRIF